MGREEAGVEVIGTTVGVGLGGVTVAAGAAVIVGVDATRGVGSGGGAWQATIIVIETIQKH